MSASAILPTLFVERLRKIIPDANIEAVLKSFSEPKPTTFRANTLKISPDDLEIKLRQLGLTVERVSWYKDAFILREARLEKLQETESYKQGELYVQQLSSMVPVLVLDPQPEDAILDLCAAPGSKTTQMAALMQGRGHILANEKSRVRFYKLKANLTMQGAGHVECSLNDAHRVARRFASRAFRKILLDVPCTTEGRFYIRKPSSLGYWKLAKVKQMGYQQKRLLRSALDALAPGGVLIYSTCTFAPEENEEVLDWALHKTERCFQIEPLDLPFPNIQPGLTAWGEKELDPTVQNARRILPTPEMEGFFIAKLRKE